MPKRSPHPHVSWRGGRPRFQPDQKLRAAGHRGFDLMHADGRWYTLGEAIDWSRAFRKENGLELRPRRQAVFKPAPSVPTQTPYRPTQKGYIYFLKVGDRVKIGFSTQPGLRLQSLLTGIADHFDYFISVRGTMAVERQLQEALAGHRTRGEWFRTSLSVRRIVQRHVAVVLEDGNEE